MGPGTVFLAAAMVLVSSHVTHAATTADKTILEALKMLNRKTLVDLIETAGLTFSLNDPGRNLTLFAPNERDIPRDLSAMNLTVDQLKADNTKLNNLLLNHVLGEEHFTKDFVNEKVFTTLGGHKVRTNHYLYNNRYFVDGSIILQSNLQCKNGVIHGIQHILNSINGDVFSIVSNRTELSTLLAAVKATGLGDFLKDQSPITLFAPTNEAFMALGDIVQSLLTKPDLLREILKYHVVPGTLYRGGMHNDYLHTFNEVDSPYLHGSGGIDAARFTKMDLSASNGVVHTINRVLVPDSVKDQL